MKTKTNYKVWYPLDDGEYPVFSTEEEATALANYIQEAYNEFVEVSETDEPSNYIMKFTRRNS